MDQHWLWDYTAWESQLELVAYRWVCIDLCGATAVVQYKKAIDDRSRRYSFCLATVESSCHRWQQSTIQLLSTIKVNFYTDQGKFCGAIRPKFFEQRVLDFARCAAILVSAGYLGLPDGWFNSALHLEDDPRCHGEQFEGTWHLR